MLPALFSFSIARMLDFYNRIKGTEIFALHASGTTVKIYPWPLCFRFFEQCVHRAIFHNAAWIAVFANLRMYQRSFHQFNSN
jgi:hypothetical protein